MIVLDTSVCIDLLRRRPADPRAVARSLAESRAGVSTITVAELTTGAAKSARVAYHMALLDSFLSPLTILPFDDAAARHYGPLRALLEAEGRPIGPMDTLIAAHAQSLNARVLTRNLDEFRRVAGLEVLDRLPGLDVT